MGRLGSAGGVAKLASLLSIAYLHGLTVFALHIRPQTCRSFGQMGTCMFVWECIKTEGKHLGTCVDGFLFGSCCAHNETSNIVAGSTLDRYSSTAEVTTTYYGPQTSANLSSTLDRKPVSSTRHPSYSTSYSTSPPVASTKDYVRTSVGPPIESGPSTFKPMTWSGSVRPTTERTSSSVPTTTTTMRSTSTVGMFTSKPQTSASSNRPYFRPRPTNRPFSSSVHRPLTTAVGVSKTTTSYLSTDRNASTTETPEYTKSPSPSTTLKNVEDPKTTTSHFSLFDFLNRNYTVYQPSTTKHTTPAPAFTFSLSSFQTPSSLFPVTTNQGTSIKFPSRPTWKPVILTGLPIRPISTQSVKSTSTVTAPSSVPKSTTEPKTCGIQNPHPQQKVVGGKNSAFGSWPWQASVRRTSFFGFSSTHRCGGALISRQWVATAGHCVDDLLLSQIKIRVGEYDFASVQEPHGYVERGVKKKVVHPRYNFFTYENDLALVQLEEPIDGTKYPHIGPICLPPSEEDLVGKNATVTGWGRLSEGGVLPSILQEVQVPIISNEKCKNMFLAAGRHEYIPEIFMCAGFEEGGRDSCQGDSGGPLQIQDDDGHWFLAGIISWGIGCAEPNMPGVCTRISKFKDWVLQNIT